MLDKLHQHDVDAIRSGSRREGLEAARSESVADINTPSILNIYALGRLQLPDKHKLRCHEASGKYRLKVTAAQNGNLPRI
jgi:hypothetical protein